MGMIAIPSSMYSWWLIINMRQKNRFSKISLCASNISWLGRNKAPINHSFYIEYYF